MLKLENLSKTFDGTTQILKNLNFSLHEKKFSGLLGPSGCGKTTLLRIIAGLEHPSEGVLRFADTTWVDCEKKILIPPEKRNVGMVFQNYALWPHMTVFENVAFPLKVKKTPKNQIAREVDRVLELVQMKGFEDRVPQRLSGGQQQRVALARAIAQKPGLLLLDEPLSNLDASLRASMREELKALQQRLGISAVIVTHDWADASALCDEIIVLNKGVIEQQGSAEEIKKNPSSAFVKKISE